MCGTGLNPVCGTRMASLRGLVLAAALAGAAAPAFAADLKISPGDSIESVLTAQKDKRITLRLRSGQELTGVLKMVSPKMVQLSVLGGREYFDAVIPLESVEAVLIRTKE